MGDIEGPGTTFPAGASVPVEPAHRRRLSALVVLLTLAFAGLIGRLYVLQVLRHGEKTREMGKMLRSFQVLPGFRGDIRSSDGTIFAREVTEYTVAIDPQVISPQNLPRVIDLFCRGLGISDEERRQVTGRLRDRMARADAGEGSAPRFVPIRRGVAAGLVGELLAASAELLPPPERRGLIFQPIHFRQYPRDAFLGSVIGSVKPGGRGTDLEGVEGLELLLDPTLSGRDGQRKLRCEGRRIDRWYWPGEVDIQPIHGYNAVLTIDSRIQGIAEEELERGLEREKAPAGVVIIMDPRCGDILAMVNLPSLDPNHYHEYPKTEFKERRRNRAIESQFEPGSTIKPFIAAVAYEKGLFRLDEQVSPGGRTAHFGRRLVQDVSDHGPLTFSEAVIFSSNIGMTHVGLKLGRDGLIETLDRFGFQKPTGIGLPGEARGKRTERKKWSETYTSVSVSFGYEVMVTPIQLCAAFSSLINGGRYFAPRVLKGLERSGEEVPVETRELRRTVSEETSGIMREILVQVVERGTAKAQRIPGFPFGGKTGTRISTGRNGRDCLSSFIAFAPAEDPQVVVLVMIERPTEHHYGSTVAGPVVTGILKKLFPAPEPAEGDARSVAGVTAAGEHAGARSEGAARRTAVPLAAAGHR